MLIGYARTSTTDQAAGIQAQERDLLEIGCSKLFVEQVSSMGIRRQLEAALDYVREGDTLVVTKLDRLARFSDRSVEHRWPPGGQEGRSAGVVDVRHPDA